MAIDIAESARRRRIRMTTLNDPMGRAFIEFFRKQGFKFVDVDTGKEIKFDEENEQDRASVLGDADNNGDNDGSGS